MTHTCGALLVPLYPGSTYVRCPKCKVTINVKVVLK